MVRVSVVIPAYNEEKLLPATLAAVDQARAAWTRRGWDSEVVVCNNNSTDRTAALAEAAGARVVFEPHNGIARARNAGARAARGGWILFLDADSRPSPELFAAVAEAIDSGRVLAGGTILRMDSGGRLVQALAHAWNQLSRLTGWMAGAFIFVDAQVFHEIGGFADRLYASEEVDLAR
ncbi:MAG: glycosyltransferase, partial [Verrucomicrobiota bacterium]